ncbi:MAG: hypothetical protein GY913_31235 [Proteobacteria bacterium]|nr:hypothetical protein [Pseudomonadota bacterium]MCP4921393.1 hypothetical protein [Pseudomonadota bacterium]
MILLALTLGCGNKATRAATAREGRYELGEPGDGWRKVKSGGADFAFRHTDAGTVIYADSNCGSRFEDARLEDLAEHLSFGVRVGEAAFQEHFELDGRSAYMMRAEGSLDGVPVEMGATVLKKDLCVYDIVIIGPPGERFQHGWSGYQTAVSGFRTTY